MSGYDDIRQLASLAKIYLTDAEVEAIGRDISAMLEKADALPGGGDASVGRGIPDAPCAGTEGDAGTRVGDDGGVDSGVGGDDVDMDGAETDLRSDWPGLLRTARNDGGHSVVGRGIPDAPCAGTESDAGTHVGVDNAGDGFAPVGRGIPDAPCAGTEGDAGTHVGGDDAGTHVGDDGVLAGRGYVTVHMLRDDAPIREVDTDALLGQSPDAGGDGFTIPRLVE